MIDQKPALISLDRDRPRSYLGALPCRLISGDRPHDMSVMSPEFHVLTEADENITKRSMSCITGSREQRVHTIDLLREQHTIPVIGKECILQLYEFLEIIGIGYADRRSMIAVTPCDIISVLQEADPRIITVFPVKDLLIRSLEMDRLILDLPVNAVPASSCKNIHTDRSAVTTEYPCKAILKRNYRTVKNTVGNLISVSSDNRIFAVAPYRHGISFRLVLPWNIWQ